MLLFYKTVELKLKSIYISSQNAYGQTISFYNKMYILSGAGNMKEYKGKFTTKLFWAGCGLCAGWFVFNLTGKLTHSLFISSIAALLIVAGFMYKVFYLDNISLIMTDERELLIKRFGKIIKTFVIDKYDWSEYSKYCNTKNAEDQDIYYVSKETGNEDYIDATNFSDDDYQQILTALGAKNTNEQPVKVTTTKK